jgi:hypothetical protein
MKLHQIAIIPAVALCIAAADRPSGLEVWQTCREDARVVCPGLGPLNQGALKSCMKGNFSQLGSRCQTVIRQYQEGRRDTVVFQPRPGGGPERSPG